MNDKLYIIFTTLNESSDKSAAVEQQKLIDGLYSIGTVIKVDANSQLQIQSALKMVKPGGPVCIGISIDNIPDIISTSEFGVHILGAAHMYCMLAYFTATVGESGFRNHGKVYMSTRPHLEDAIRDISEKIVADTTL